MSPKEVLQTAGSELDRLGQQLIGCEWTTAQPLATLESITAKLVSLHEELASLKAAELREMLESLLTKAKRIQTLLESGTAFHCYSIFGRAASPDTYSCDGTFSTSHDSRIVFQG